MQYASAIQRAIEAYRLVAATNSVPALSPYLFVALALVLVAVVFAVNRDVRVGEMTG